MEGFVQLHALATVSPVSTEQAGWASKPAKALKRAVGHII